MNEFVNKIKTKDGVEYDIQDKRLTVTADDAGKMVAVDENGDLTLVNASSGGTKLYRHDISYGMSELISFVTTESSPLGIYSVFGTTCIAKGENVDFQPSFYSLRAYIKSGSYKDYHLKMLNYCGLQLLDNNGQVVTLTASGFTDTVTEL